MLSRKYSNKICHSDVGDDDDGDDGDNDGDVG